MPNVGVWSVQEDGRPIRVGRSNAELERSLEDWIENDAGLLQDGLTIVGRQIILEGGRLDLLAVNPQGEWVIVELKAGRLYREVLVQALDYSSSIASMSALDLRAKVEAYLSSTARPEAAEGLTIEDPDDRQVAVIVAGIGADPGLERITHHLSSRFEVPIEIVTFDIFNFGDGRKMLIREASESDEKTVAPSRLSLEGNLAEADQQGIGDLCRLVLAAAERNGLGTKLFKRAIMVTPPSNRNRILFTIRMWAKEGKVQLWLWAEGFAEFFPVVNAEVVQRHLGPDPRAWRLLGTEEAKEFASGLDELFTEIRRRQDQTP